MSIVSQTAPSDYRWLVCHTKPRCEKKFAALLSAAGFVHYLPLIESVRRYASGEKRFSKPLFPGYVFAQVPLSRQKRVYEQQLLVRTLTVDDERTFLAQLEQVKQTLSAGVTVALKPLLNRGRPVRISSGGLRGIEGVVEDADHPDEVVIKVDVLQQGLLVKVPVEHIQPLH